MYCGKCGKFVEDGQVCPCEGQTQYVPNQGQNVERTNSYGEIRQSAAGVYDTPAEEKQEGRLPKAIRFLLKALGAVLVVLALVFSFFDMYTYERDFEIRERDAERYEEEAEEAAEDFEEGKISISGGFYAKQDDSNPLQVYSSSYFYSARDLLIFAFISFALYVGALFASRFNKKADTVRAVAQGLFFALLLLALVMVALYVSNMENMYGSYTGPNDTESEPYISVYSLASGWWLTTLVCGAGILVTAVSSFLTKDNK